jgi:hypothetical protein
VLIMHGNNLHFASLDRMDVKNSKFAFLSLDENGRMPDIMPIFSDFASPTSITPHVFPFWGNWDISRPVARKLPLLCGD